jgi:hypothetical protein
MRRAAVALLVLAVLAVIVAVYFLMRSGPVEPQTPVVAETKTSPAEPASEAKGAAAESQPPSVPGEPGDLVTDLGKVEGDVPSGLGMSSKDAEQAMAAFDESVGAVASVRSLSGHYSVSIEASNPKSGTLPKTQRTGTLELVVSPTGGLNSTRDRPRPKVSVRLTDDQAGIVMVKDDALDWQKSPEWWPEEGKTPRQLSDEIVTARYNESPVQHLSEFVLHVGMFHLVREMGQTSSEAGFFTAPGFIGGVSSAEESEKLFGGEGQYLFHLPAGPLATLWVSRDKHEWRRLEAVDEQKNRFIHRYENYAGEESAGGARFPTRYSMTVERAADAPREPGLTMTMTLELSDVELNKDIPLSRFQRPP